MMAVVDGGAGRWRGEGSGSGGAFVSLSAHKPTPAATGSGGSRTADGRRAPSRGAGASGSRGQSAERPDGGSSVRRVASAMRSLTPVFAEESDYDVATRCVQPRDGGAGSAAAAAEGGGGAGDGRATADGRYAAARVDR